jgi:uncharacterized protein YjbJ (UPF0337 family)
MTDGCREPEQDRYSTHQALGGAPAIEAVAAKRAAAVRVLSVPTISLPTLSAALRLSGRSGVNGSLNEEFRWRGGEARAKSPSEVEDRVRYVRFAPCAAYSVPAVGSSSGGRVAVRCHALWRGCGRYSAGPLLVYVVPQYKIGARVPVAMEDAMGSRSDQIKGLANQAAGKLKQGVGKVTGSKETQARGVAQEVKGKAQQTMGKAKSAVKDTANKVADKANKKL